MNSGIVLLGIAFVLLIVLMRSIKIVPQKQVKLIERLGRYHRTAEAGLNTIVPFLDSVARAEACPRTCVVAAVLRARVLSSSSRLQSRFYER